MGVLPATVRSGVSGVVRRRRGFGTRVQPRFLLLLLILPVAFIADRAASHAAPITQQRATEIARAQIDYKTDGTNIRFVRRGLPPKPYWAVSLWQQTATGERTNVTVVLIDAGDGSVQQVSRDVDP